MRSALAQSSLLLLQAFTAGRNLKYFWHRDMSVQVLNTPIRTSQSCSLIRNTSFSLGDGQVSSLQHVSLFMAILTYLDFDFVPFLGSMLLQKLQSNASHKAQEQTGSKLRAQPSLLPLASTQKESQSNTVSSESTSGLLQALGGTEDPPWVHTSVTEPGTAAALDNTPWKNPHGFRLWVRRGSFEALCPAQSKAACCLVLWILNVFLVFPPSRESGILSACAERLWAHTHTVC